MAQNDGGINISTSLQVDEAQKQLNALAKKGAKTEINLKVNTAELERAQRYLDDIYKAQEMVAKWLDENATRDKTTGNIVANDPAQQAEVDKYLEASKKLDEEQKTWEKNVENLKAKNDELNESLAEQTRAMDTLQNFINEETAPKEMSGDEFWEQFTQKVAEYNDQVEKVMEASRQSVLQTTLDWRGVVDAVGAVGGAFFKLSGIIADNLYTGLKKAGKALNPFLNAFKGIQKYGTKIGKFIGEVLENDSANLLTTILHKLRDFLNANEEMSQSLARLRGAISTAFQPIGEWIMPMLIRFVNVITAVVNAIAKLTAGLFGMTAQQAQANAKALDKQAKATAGVKKETDKVTTSIDELNTLQSSSGGGGGAGGGDVAYSDDFTYDLLGKLDTLGGDIAQKINDAIASVDWHVVGQYLGNGLAQAIHVAWDFVTTLDWTAIGTAMAVMLNEIVYAINPQELGELLWGVLSSGFQILYGILQEMDVKAFAKKLIAVFKAVAEQFGKMLSTINWGELAYKAYDFLYTALTDESWGEIALNILKGLASGLAGFFSVVWEAMMAIVHALITGVRKLLGINSPSTVFADIGTQMMQGLVNGITSMIERVKQVCITIWNTIKGVFSNVSDWFKNTFATAWAKVKEVFSKGGEVFAGIKDGISETFKRIVNGLIDGINAVIAVPFRAINNALSRIRDISIAGLTPFRGRISLINIPQIPKLAQGTVVPPNNQFLAMLGDNKKEPEIVSPLSTMKEALLEALAQNRQTITVNVDGRQLFDIVVSQNNEEVRRTGESPLMV